MRNKWIGKLSTKNKFKPSGQGFYFQTPKIKPKIYSNSVTITGTTASQVKASTNVQSFSTLGDMLLRRYVVDFIANMQGNPVVAGEVGEWRIIRYEGVGPILSVLRPQPDERIHIQHNCGPADVLARPEVRTLAQNAGEEVDCWMTAMIVGADKRRKLCLNCHKRVPDNLKSLVELIR